MGSSGRGHRLEEVQPRRHRDGFGAPAHAQLAIDTADLGLNRIGGDDERLCHLRVRLPGDKAAAAPAVPAGRAAQPLASALRPLQLRLDLGLIRQGLPAR